MTAADSNPKPIVRSSAHPVIYAYPGIPDYWSPLMQRQAQLDLDLVAEHYTGFEQHLVDRYDPRADVEDFWETCARAAAAVRAAQSTNAEFVDQHPAFDWDQATMAQRLGPVSTIEEDSHGYDPLQLHPIVQKHAGRWISLASLPDEERPHLVFENNFYDLVKQRAEAGVEKLVVKLPVSKTGLTILEIHPGITKTEIFRQLIADEDLGWTFIRLMGQPDALLVQDWVEMTHEYRLFVVDGKVVSSAGCIEEFTPYERADASVLFDTRTRKFRGNGVVAHRAMHSHVEDSAELVGKYLEAGARIAAEYGGSVGIDLAAMAQPDGSKQIVVVELNTLPNCGLYASNPDAVYTALSTAADRGYDTYAWKQEDLPTSAITDL